MLGLLLSLGGDAYGQPVHKWNPLFVPDVDKSSGIIIELLSRSQDTNWVQVRRYSWNAGDFISEAGLANAKVPTILTNIYSAAGRINKRTWEYAKDTLIWHNGKNAYNNTFKGRTAEEMSLLGLFSKGMEVDDFATIRATVKGDFHGKWHSTQPMQEMIGRIEESSAQEWKLEAWTPNRLLHFVCHMHFVPEVSSALPEIIRYRQILDGEESQVSERRIVYAALDRSDEEFDPQKRYNPSKLLQMENDAVKGRDRAGNLVPFASAQQPADSKAKKKWAMLLGAGVGSLSILLWLFNRKTSTSAE